MGNVDSRIEAGTRGEGHKIGNGDKKKQKKERPSLKNGGDLLSRIVVQYHRRAGA